MQIFRNFIVSLKHSKGAGLLNIVGLSVAFTVFTIILIQVYYDYTYNGSFPKADRIYRCEFGDQEYGVTLPVPMAEMIGRSIPELAKVGVFCPYGKETVFSITTRQGEKVFYKEPVSYADTGILRIFDVHLVAGNAAEALTQKHRLLLPESVARKWFGEREAVGQTVVYDGLQEMNIAAVYKDLPANSSLKNRIYSKDFNDGLGPSDWSYTHFYEIAPGTDLQALNRKILDLPRFRELFCDWRYDAATQEKSVLFHFRPLHEVYFARNIENPDGGNRSFTDLLLAVGFLVLAIAWVNFVNFSIAQAPVRMRALNTQRTFGASRSFIRRCLLSEAIFFASLAWGGGMLFCRMMSTTIVQQWIPVSLDPSEHIGLCCCVGSIGIIAGLLAGLYPAFYMTASPPAVVLKGSQALSPQGIRLRNGLLVFQFLVSLVLVISVFFIRRQLQMMQNRSWGIEKENVVYIETNRELSAHRETFFNELRTSPTIRGVTYASLLLGDDGKTEHWTSTAWVDSEERILDAWIGFVAPDFLQFFGISLKEGERFRDTASYHALVNQAFVQKYHLDNPYAVNFSGHRIQGVMEDFNYLPFHYRVEPLMLSVVEDRSDVYYYIRIDPSLRQQALEHIRRTIRRFTVNHSADVRYLNESLQSVYEQEIRLGRLTGLFSAVAVIIALMGVYGLVMFTTRFKAKEIGIRKVNGATAAEILQMLSSSFFRLVLLAFLLACPLAWYLLSVWLENFAYKTVLSPWGFALPGLSVSILVLSTAGWQSWKSARCNPVEILRSE